MAARVHPIHNTFSAGELSPLMQGRTDYAGYAHGAAALENWIVLLQGGIQTRPGFHYAWTVKTQTRPTRVMPFEFSVSQAYILELGHKYIRFGRNGARLVQSNGTTPVEVATTYDDDEIFAIRTAQSNDILYLVHGSHPPRKLARLSDTSWSLTPVTLRPPPSIERGYRSTRTGTLSAKTGTGVTITTVGSLWLSADVNRQLGLVSGLGRAVIRSVTSTTVAVVDILEPFASTALAAFGWRLEGSPVANVTPSGVGPVGALITLTLSPSTLTTLVTNGTFDSATGWTDKDTGTGVSTIAGGVCTLVPGDGPGLAAREQELTGLTAGMQYQIRYDGSVNVVGIQVGSASGGDNLLTETYSEVGKDRQLTFTANGPSAFLQVRSGLATFTSVVDNVRVLPATVAGWRHTDADGAHYVKVAGGIVRITAYNSSIEVTGEVVKDLQGTEEVQAGAWALEEVAWSSTLGYPTAVGLSEQRLWFARGQTVWGSVTGDYENFGAGAAADDSVEYTIASPQLNPVQWLLSPRTLLIGTAAEVTRFAGVAGGPVTPSSVQALSEDSLGSAGVQPVRIGNTLLFVQREHVALLEMVYNGAADSYQPDEVSKLSEHLFAGYQIVEMCYEPRPATVLWLARSDGVLLAATYSSKEKLAAFTRVSTAGQVESVMRLPASGVRGSQVYCVVKRGSNRFIEYLDESLQVDSGLTYSGAAVSTLTGLTHLNGRTVQIVGNDGIVYPSQVVSGGQVTGLSPAVTSAQVGLGFTCTAALLEPEVELAAGTSMQSQKRYGEVTVRLLNTQGLLVNGEALAFRTPGMAMDVAVPAFTGKKRVTHFGWDRDPQLTLVQTQPLPATVLAVTSTLLIGD